MNILKVLDNIPVQKLAWQLRAHPGAWNQHTERTAPEHSPHREIDDIYVRYGPDRITTKDTPHVSEWYADVPEGIMALARPMVESLAQAVGGREIGMVLITRVPPGKEVKAHRDVGWHAEYYEKFAVQIEAAPGQKFCFDGEALETQPGDVFWFYNQAVHWVTNPTPYERVTMICCFRRH